MFSGGIGAMEDIHVHKEPPKFGEYVPTPSHSLVNPPASPAPPPTYCSSPIA